MGGYTAELLLACVVRDEPVVDVEGHKEGGEAGDGDDVQNTGVGDQEQEAVLAEVSNKAIWKTFVRYQVMSIGWSVFRWS